VKTAYTRRALFGPQRPAGARPASAVAPECRDQRTP
jgi:hypothetical protein